MSFSPKIEPDLRIQFIKAAARKDLATLLTQVRCDIEVTPGYTPLLYLENIKRYTDINIAADVFIEDLDALAENKNVLHIRERKPGKSPALTHNPN